MLNNIGLSGIVMIALVFVLPIWLIVTLSKRKAKERKRIADALEEIAELKKADDSK